MAFKTGSGYLDPGHFQVTVSTDDYLKAKELHKIVCFAAEFGTLARRPKAGWEICPEGQGGAGSRAVERGFRPFGCADLDLLSMCPPSLVSIGHMA